MRPEERQQLLHEGTGPRVVSAYVEIIFDNSDNRIPIDREEVSVRRVIGAKKDSYYLDKKHVTKSDVINLLESAGFSRSNPYYIVKQGKINQLALAPDSQRLKLLREVAGTRVYDERKVESKTILKDTEAKREKIEEMLGYIEERLSTLEEEKEELRAYQNLDKMRRSLEYTIHDKELRDTRSKLEQLEDARKGNKEGSRERNEKIAAARSKIESLEREVKELEVSLQTLQSEKQQLAEDDQEMIRHRAKLEFDVKDLEESLVDDKKSKESCQQELTQLEKTVEKRQKELGRLLPRYTRQKTEEEQLNTRLKACEQRRSELFAKQGRGQQFASVDARDAWIRREAGSLSESLENKKRQLAQLHQDVEQSKAKVKRQEQDIKERGEDLEQRREAIDRVNREHAQLKLRRDDLTNERKELWRREAGIDQTIQNARDELAKCERNLRGTMGKAVNRGLDSVKRVVEEKHMSGVYGPLLENFTCEPRVFTAVEVTAGNRLFHVIVDTDRTASQILSIMNKQKLPGEVTFLPLNKLNPPNMEYPNAKNDAIPMVEQMKFNPMFQPAMRQVFGRTLICRDIDRASHFAKNSNHDCVTLDGDQVSHKGTLTGGYYDTRRSRLEMHRQMMEQRERLEAAENERSQLRHQLDQLEGKVTQVLGDLQKTETKQIQLKETFERQKMDIRTITRELQANRRALEPKEQSLASQETDIQSMEGALGALTAELGTELRSQLNSGEQSEVERLGEEVQTLQQQLKECLRERTELESEKNKLENLLSSNLLRRKEQLVQELEELSMADHRQQLEMQTAELDHLCSNINTTRSRLEEVVASVDDHGKRIKEKETALDKWKTMEREQLDSIEEEAKAMEKLANKRSLLLKKKEESMRKIRELGSLPADAFDKYQGLPLSQLWKKLHKCNTELKKYSHVNKKALEQFVNFSERKETLTSRKEQLDRDYQSIIDLMDVLEQRKYEAIQFTFKQVSKNFSDVFQELVPNGKGQLVMKRAEELPSADTEDEDSLRPSGSGRGPSVDEHFTGVSIRVSFTGVASETKELQQLSGGQKSLVALTLIFAIQKCDPAPFYLFDEIDQALDSHHRHSVAAMIHRLADNAQFITTTFRPELVEVADKCYGVKFQNKVSHINAVSKEAAKDFIEQETADK
jgi:structural maintenance of chromosome 3 (chondroitin sulfate proteoglycan 6)